MFWNFKVSIFLFHVLLSALCFSLSMKTWVELDVHIEMYVTFFRLKHLRGLTMLDVCSVYFFQHALDQRTSGSHH